MRTAECGTNQHSAGDSFQYYPLQTNQVNAIAKITDTECPRTSRFLVLVIDLNLLLVYQILHFVTLFDLSLSNMDPYALIS